MPNDWASVDATAIALRPLGILRSSSRSGGLGLARSLSRSLGRTSGRCAGRGTMSPSRWRIGLRAFALAVDVTVITTMLPYSIDVSTTRDIDRSELRPLDARSLALSVLLG